MRKQIVYFFHKLLRHRVSSSGNAAGLEDGERLETDGGISTVGKTMGTDTDSTAESVWRDADDEASARKEFERIVNKGLSESRMPGCLLVADVDKFREINHIYGQDTGDAILRNVANTLSGCLPDYGCIGRQGGDIFAMWLPSALPERVETLRRQTGVVNDRLMHPSGELPPVSVSVGAAFGVPGDDCRSLGKKAVKALNRVKESGRCGFEIYEDKETGTKAMEE